MTASDSPPLRIATRESPLALWQAHHIKRLLQHHYPHLPVDIIGMTTRGDQILDRSLAKIGGKGLFVKELEMALLNGRADIAVHSMKDLPMLLPDGLSLGTICEREDPSDALVSNLYADLSDLPAGSRVGTSSLRRQCQLRAAHGHLKISDLRGNVNTRLAKLEAGDYDAIILATAGLVRLQLADRIRQRLPTALSLPAAGQGAIGIECRSDDQRILELLGPLGHAATRICVTAERAVNRHLEGSCEVPIAAYAELEADQQIYLRARVGSPDGSLLLCDELRGSAAAAEQLGVELAERLLHRGARDILAAIHRA